MILDEKRPVKTACPKYQAAVERMKYAINLVARNAERSVAIFRGPPSPDKR